MVGIIIFGINAQWKTKCNPDEYWHRMSGEDVLERMSPIAAAN